MNSERRKCTGKLMCRSILRSVKGSKRLSDRMSVLGAVSSLQLLRQSTCTTGKQTDSCFV